MEQHNGVLKLKRNIIKISTNYTMDINNDFKIAMERQKIQNGQYNVEVKEQSRRTDVT